MKKSSFWVFLTALSVSIYFSACNSPENEIFINVTTIEVTDVTKTTAVSGGSMISSDPKVDVSKRGVCWGRSLNPTIKFNPLTNDSTGTEPYTSLLTGLKPGTTYCVRAYVTTNFGTTFYGNELLFTTND